MKHVYAILMVLLLVLATRSEAATCYVSPTGDNGNTCSAACTGSPSASPKQTLDNFFDSCTGVTFTAGDTLYLRGGVYNASIDDTTSNIPSGTNFTTGAVTIASYPGETATITGIGLYSSSVAKQFIIFDRLKVDKAGASGEALYLRHAHHIRFQNGQLLNALQHSGAQFVTTATPLPAGHHNEILNSTISNNGNSRLKHGIYISQQNSLIDGNIISNNAGYGIQVYSGGSATQTSGTIVRNNTFFGNAKIADAAAQVTLTSGANLLAYNNVLYTPGSTGKAGLLMPCYSGANNTIKYFNNTVYNHGDVGIQVFAACTGSGNEVSNNIAYNNGTNISIASAAVVTQQTNLTTNPLFLNAGAGNFRLQSESAAINAGTDKSSVFTTDKEGTVRGSGAGTWEIGAYAFGGSAAPVVLVFTQPPTTEQEDTTITPPVVVCAQIDGTTQSTFSNTITLTTTAGSGILTGGGATAPVNGCATFAGLSIDDPDNDYKLTAAATGATSVQSAAFEITAATAPSVASGRLMGLKMR